MYVKSHRELDQQQNTQHRWRAQVAAVMEQLSKNHRECAALFKVSPNTHSYWAQEVCVQVLVVM